MTLRQLFNFVDPKISNTVFRKVKNIDAIVELNQLGIIDFLNVIFNFKSASLLIVFAFQY